MRYSLKHVGLPATMLLTRGAAAADRFPKPDFEQVYKAPELTWPTAGSLASQLFDVTLLTLALAAAAYLLLKRRSRRGTVLLGLISLAYFGFYRKGCFCPIGTLQPIAESLLRGQATTIGTVAFFLLPLGAALLFGRVFCAAVCPLGMIQDVVAVRPQRLSRPLDAALRLLPVIYLALGLLLAATGTAYVICRYDPFVPLFRLTGSPYIVLSGGGLLVLGIVLARPYCRYLCPYGVLLGWFSQLSWLHVSITPDACISCRLCADSCPVGAIDAPMPKKNPEVLHTGIRRLGVILALAPFIIAFAGWGMSSLAPRLATLHQDSKTATQLLLERAGSHDPSLDTAAFRLSDRDEQDLIAAHDARRARLSRGGWWAGGLVGFVIVGRLIQASTRQRRRDYVPNRSSCLSCGRCFRHCPKEHVRAKNMLEES